MSFVDTSIGGRATPGVLDATESSIASTEAAGPPPVAVPKTLAVSVVVPSEHVAV